MAILQGVWKQHLRPRAVVGYGGKIFLPSPPNYVTRSPGDCEIPCSVVFLACVAGDVVGTSLSILRAAYLPLTPTIPTVTQAMEFF